MKRLWRKRAGIWCIAVLMILAVGGVYAQNGESVSTDRAGKFRLGIDATVPVPLIMIHKDLWEVLAGPTLHYSVTDRLDVKAALAPALHLSWWLTKNISDLGSEDGLAAVGLLEGGARYYFSRKADSFFIDGDAAAGFLFARGDVSRELFNEERIFRTSFSIPSVSLGYEYGSREGVTFSVEGGLMALISFEDISDFDADTVVWPKAAVTVYF